MKQKNTTKNTKKKSRRRRRKYPALERRYNLSLKQDYIEVDYVNGVKNEYGEQVIRPLNDEEKEFLNKFNEEVINANFLYDDELKDLYDEIKELRVKDSPSTEDKERLDYLNLLRWAREEDVLLYPDKKDQKKIYGENNARNRCLYNRHKAAGSLSHIEDNYYDIEEKENTEYICEDSGKNILKDKIELKKESKIILRKSKIKKV